MMRRSLILCACSILAVSMLRAQFATDSVAFDGDVEKDFVAAMRVYQSGDHEAASGAFLDHVRKFPRGHRTTGAMIMGAKSLAEAKRFRESIKLLKDLLDIYPSTLYAGDAWYTLGLDYYRLRRYEDAADAFVQTRSRTQDTILLAHSEQMLDVLASEHLTPLQLDQLRSTPADSTVSALLTLRLAEQAQRGGDTRKAMDLLQPFRTWPHRRPHVAEAVSFLARLEQGRVLNVGVVLPLMLKSARGASREIGVEFLEGMKMAVDEFNAGSLSKVALEVRDTERDPSVAARMVADLATDDGVAAILGPISSQEVFACAGIANAKGIPIMTPTGTSNGIAAIGPYVFQANPDYDTRGRAMAQYAWARLGVRSFGVIAPTDAVGKLMADAFIDQVRLLGGDLVSVQWYAAGATDVRSQIEDMRRIALKRKEVPYIHFGRALKREALLSMLMAGAQQKTVDSLMEVGGTMSLDSLFGPNGRLLADSLKLPTMLPVIKYDSLGVVVDSIGAIFCPIASSDEIAVISAQMRFFNFKTQLLGTGDWNEPAELDRNRQYTDGVAYSVDSWPDLTDTRYKTFATSYQSQFKRVPSVNTLFGYDAAAALMKVISRGATLRDEIAEGLGQLKGFRGLHSTISFSPKRVNGFLSVLRYRQGKIVKDGEIDLAIPTP